METPKRLAPTFDTTRELYLRSGNQCAFPNCKHMLIDSNSNVVAQICHIEGALKGSERFREAMTNEERRAYSNLIILCYQHHVETNDASKYPVEKMLEMKARHEARFSDPIHVLLEAIKDWTTVTEPAPAKNLQLANVVLEWNLSDEELKESVAELDEYLGAFSRVPAETRHFVGEVAKRMHRLKDTGSVYVGRRSTTILLSDIVDALRIGQAELSTRIDQLVGHSIGDVDEFPMNSTFGRGLSRSHLRSGWRLWDDLATFCSKAAMQMEVFTHDLNFAALDDPPATPS